MAILTRFAHLIFVLNAMKYDRSVAPTMKDLSNIGQAQAINYSLIAMAWTATCSVKLCFLSSFKSLIRNVSVKITVWYWSAVALSLVAWLLAWTAPFMICPYSGSDLCTFKMQALSYID